MPPRKRYRRRYCGTLLPVAKRPEGSMLLYHLGRQHMDQLRPYLTRMETECIDRMVLELFEVVEGEETR